MDWNMQQQEKKIKERKEKSASNKKPEFWTAPKQMKPAQLKLFGKNFMFNISLTNQKGFSLHVVLSQYGTTNGLIIIKTRVLNTKQEGSGSLYALTLLKFVI